MGSRASYFGLRAWKYELTAGYVRFFAIYRLFSVTKFNLPNTILTNKVFWFTHSLRGAVLHAPWCRGLSVEPASTI
jgi:hypothetical protein